MKLKINNIRLNQAFASKEEAIRFVGGLLVEDGAVEPSYVDSMLEREQLVTTHMGNFVAIPHGTDEGKAYVKQTCITIAQVPQGVNFAVGEDEEKMAMIIFGIAGIGNEHLDLLAKIAIFCSDVDNVVRLVNAQTEQALIDMFEEEGIE